MPSKNVLPEIEQKKLEKKKQINAQPDWWVGNYLISKSTFFFQTKHAKFYYEHTWKNPKTYTSANKCKSMYLTSAKTENLSINFVFHSVETQSNIQYIDAQYSCYLLNETKQIRYSATNIKVHPFKFKKALINDP